MAFKVFLDANIILDFTLKRQSYEDAKAIIQLAIQGKIQAYITPSIIQISGYWLTKAFGSAKAKELLLSLMVNIRVIDTGHDAVQMALQCAIPGIEDAIQYFTAISHKLDCFITLDKDLIKYATPTLPILNPIHFLKTF